MDLELSHRAELHAALGDPNRLVIVDALGLSDHSPTELADMVGIGGNLIAHHLGVLEKVGVVRRVTSEGDRRRRYVQLVPGALSGLHPLGRVHARRVVFVCTENSARSQLGEALWNKSHPIRATSAGIAPAARVHPGAVAVAARHGLDLSASRPKGLPQLSDQDLVITVCDRAHDVVTRREGIHQLHWSVPDPVSSRSTRAFDRAADVIADRIAALAPRIVEPER
jgi:ArsR family transcriptional regulator, arsenate/arsenite/antimonite-responsive transcriptional repressor / arsenate reductase (thioredoxin)